MTCCILINGKRKNVCDGAHQRNATRLYSIFSDEFDWRCIDMSQQIECTTGRLRPQTARDATRPST